MPHSAAVSPDTPPTPHQTPLPRDTLQSLPFSDPAPSPISQFTPYPPSLWSQPRLPHYPGVPRIPAEPGSPEDRPWSPLHPGPGVHKRPSKEHRPPHPPGDELGDAEDRPASRKHLLGPRARTTSARVPRSLNGPAPGPFQAQQSSQSALGSGPDARASEATSVASQLHPGQAPPPQATRRRRRRRRQRVFIWQVLRLEGKGRPGRETRRRAGGGNWASLCLAAARPSRARR